MSADDLNAPRPPEEPTELEQWTRQVREQTPDRVPGTPRKKSWRRLYGALTALVLVGGMGLALALRTPPRPGQSGPTSVEGIVLDALNRPVAGAQVFAESNLDLVVTTADDGTFVLPEAAPGRQVLVVAVETTGQEYRVLVRRHQVNDVGPLAYLAPSYD